MNVRAAIIALIVAVGSAAAPAEAAQLGIYAGLSYVMADKDADRSVFEEEALQDYNTFGFVPQSTVASFDTKDNAYGFVVGWRFSEHLAFEGGYLDLGDVTYKDRSTGIFNATPPPQDWALNLDSGTSGIALSALGILPLSYRWEVYARGGVLIANSTANLFISNGFDSRKFRASKSSADFLTGAGISFSIAEIYNIRLEYLRVFDAGDDETLGEGDVDIATLNVTVAF
jgi:opacity protein-like surface antigen